MIFQETQLADAWLICPERHSDPRGYFARTFCREEFAQHDLCTKFVQCNTSYNACAGTLRGMHFQMVPHEEIKLVRCVRGAMYDVIVDIRPSSTTYRQWISAELTTDNGHALYIPGGFAHGFLTLEDDTEVFYHMSEFYHPQSSRGFRWDDATIQIQWPTRNDLIVSEKDKSLPSMEGLSL